MLSEKEFDRAAPPLAIELCGVGNCGVWESSIALYGGDAIALYGGDAIALYGGDAIDLLDCISFNPTYIFEVRSLFMGSWRVILSKGIKDNDESKHQGIGKRDF